jgi:hypothetical protein
LGDQAQSRGDEDGSDDGQKDGQYQGGTIFAESAKDGVLFFGSHGVALDS